MSALIKSAPALEVNKLDQVAALPLGGRVKINGWDDRIEIHQVTASCTHLGPGQAAIRSDTILPAPESDRQWKYQQHYGPTLTKKSG
jgi:hypothetical protein